MSHVVLMTPDLDAELERHCVWEQVDLFNTYDVELMGFWVARDIVQYQKNFKKQSFTDKVLLDSRNKESMEPIHCLSFLVVQPKDWQLVFIFSLQGSGG